MWSTETKKLVYFIYNNCVSLETGTLPPPWYEMYRLNIIKLHYINNFM